MDTNRLSRALVGLVELVARLRGPGGCPWDAKQTDATIKTYLLEEAYEAVDAVEKGSPEEVCQELGDLLFQILFLARIAEEKGAFDLSDVLEGITEKMIRRHPHVFGDASVDSAEEVAANWAKIKKEEKSASEEDASFFQSVPKNLPALLRAHRLSERASKAGFDWPDAHEVWRRVEKECDSLRTATGEEDKERVGEEIGQALFYLANLSRHWGFNAEHLLRRANRDFTDRFEKMEARLKAAGVELDEATLEQMDEAWEKVKNQTEEEN